MTTEAFDYKQIAVDYVSRWIGDKTFYWEEWDDPTDDHTAHNCSGWAPPGTCTDYSWTLVNDIQINKVEVIGQDDDQPELTIIYLETTKITSQGSTWDEDEDDEEDSCSATYCIWIDKEGKVSHWEDEYVDGFDDELQVRIDQLLTSKIT